MSYITEYNEAATMQAIKEEGIEEGIEFGELLMVFKLVNLGILSPVTSASSVDLSTEEFQKLLEAYNRDPENFRIGQYTPKN